MIDTRNILWKVNPHLVAQPLNSLGEECKSFSLILEKYCGNIFDLCDLCVRDGEGWYKVTYQRVCGV